MKYIKTKFANKEVVIWKVKDDYSSAKILDTNVPAVKNNYDWIPHWDWYDETDKVNWREYFKGFKTEEITKEEAFLELI